MIALQCFLTHEASVAGDHRDVGNGASAGLWGCSNVGAAVAVHPCGLSLEVHRWCGRRALAAHPWIGGGVLAILGRWRPRTQQPTINR